MAASEVKNRHRHHFSILRKHAEKWFLTLFFLIWCILWLNFVARDLYRKGLLDEYKVLAKGDYEEKHAITYGERFYEFLKFVKNNVPEETFYDFAGLDDVSLDSRRGVYYLYPRTKIKHPIYVLVYEKPGYTKDGFAHYAALDNGRFILKRR